MGAFDRLKANTKVLTLIEVSLFLIITIVHLVLYFYIKETDFGNIFDAFESSPLFNFYVSDNCGIDSRIIFHDWEGRKVRQYGGRNSGKKTKIVDRADIDKINHNYFCYKHISYKDLLYNGQIIPNGEECKNNNPYTKDCGIIDTLNQRLCVKDDEKCPLYEVGIGEPKGNMNQYKYNEYHSDVYYNNENYNKQDKKIIGKVILSDGQPCYRHEEKLWRTFISEEAGDNHLQCELEIFDKFTDNRYENKGSITYRKLYEDNLPTASKELIIDEIDELKENPEVSLYSREFLGINKACDEKYSISKDDFETLKKNQKMEKLCVLIEAIVLFAFLIAPIIFTILMFCEVTEDFTIFNIFNLVFLTICLLMIFACIICHAVFLGRMINNNLSYDCSDDITNEVSRKENENTKISIKYTAVNLVMDLFILLFNILLFLAPLIIDKCKKCLPCFSKSSGKPSINETKATSKNNYNSNDIPEKPVREVIVNNRLPFPESQMNHPINNNTPDPITNLDVPPTINQGYGSNTKF